VSKTIYNKTLRNLSMDIMNLLQRISITFAVGFACTYGSIQFFVLPELYQDVLIRGKVIKEGVRSCTDRYDAIKHVLASLPVGYKVLDIGASQGYFSFRMSQDFQARCTMIEDSYTITDVVWRTGDYLRVLCELNAHIPNLVLLQKRCSAQDIVHLSTLEQFDLICAFSVIHHMRNAVTDPHEQYLKIIDTLLYMAPVVLIETPVNTGEHTLFIQKALQERGGMLLYQSSRGTLLYEIYLFDRRIPSEHAASLVPNIQRVTYEQFHGTYSSDPQMLQ
jgi:hypothetical protein